jgi:hypothetical protein
MTELKATRLVDMYDCNPGEYNSEKEIKLKPEFEWFLSDKFNELWERCKENYPPSPIQSILLDNSLFNRQQEKREDNLLQNEALGVHSSLHHNITQKDEIIEDIRCKENYPLSTVFPYPFSKSSQVNTTSIHRLGNSDIFGCNSCSIKADRIFMEHHVCSMSKKGSKK